MGNTRKKGGSAGPLKSRDAAPRSGRRGKGRRVQEQVVQEPGVGGSESTMAQAADDDVSIDSDDAFDAEDEARYGEVLKQIQQNDSRRKKRRRLVSHEDDAGSDEAEEEAGDDDDEGDLGDGEMLLSDMLGASADDDGRAQDGGGPRVAKRKPSSVDEGEEEEGDEDDEVEEDDEDDDDEDDGEEDDDDEDEEDEDVDHAGLMDMIDQLAAAQGHSRSSHGGAGDGSSGPDPLQAMTDSAFGTRAADGLTMEAMLDALKGTKGYAAVRKRLSQLGDKAVVAAPAAGVVQDRAQRQVVYEVKKKDAADWLPLVSAARRAESLNFSNTEIIHPSQAALVEKFRPETEMELAIRDLLTHAKADEEAQVEKREEEELGARGLSVAEVKARHAELAKMRALLFYEQQKRHRANKIKSKAYHRIRKRQRLRAEEAENDALRDADPDAARELDEKEARNRAEERMSLRHKNTSKWAKQVLRHGAHAQVDTRKAIAEQLQMGEDLRKKAQLESDDEEDEDDDGDVEEGDEERAARARRAAVGRLHGLLGEVEGEEKGHEEKGIMGMKFMQRAIEKQRQRAKEEVAKVLRDLEAEEEDEGDDDSDADGAVEGDSGNGGSQRQSAEKQAAATSNGKAPLAEGAMQTAAVTWGGQARMRVSGPMSISGGGDSTEADESESMAVVEEDNDDDDDVLAARMPVVLPETHAKPRGKTSAPLSAEDASSMSTTNAALRPVAAGAEGGGDKVVNPWLMPTTSARASEGKKRRGASGSGRGLLDVSAAVESVVKGDHSGVKLQQQGSQEGGRKQGQPKDRKEPRVDGHFYDDDEDAEDGEAGGGVIFGPKQEELVRRAFASVDVEADFAKEKEEAVEDEAAKEDKNAKKGNGPSAVPGWGSWAGIGAPPPPPPSTKAKGRGKGKPEPQPRISHGKKQAEEEDLGTVEQGAIQKLGDKRKDKSLPTVIISQKRIKAAAKLKLTEVPYPFTSVEQYERSLRRPLGKEWNTSLSVRDSVRPPVRVRPGTLVEPLKLGKRHPAVYYDKKAEQGKGEEEEARKSKRRKEKGR